jgi:hypothetical protein
VLILKQTGGKTMKYYERLVDLGRFTRGDVEAMAGNRETAHSIIGAYKKKRFFCSKIIFLKGGADNGGSN